MLPVEDPDAAASEVERWVRDLGFISGRPMATSMDQYMMTMSIFGSFSIEYRS